MQQNVQTSQVAAPPIVQPQQTPTLPANEQTETQTPSQEPPFTVSIFFIKLVILFTTVKKCTFIG